MRSSLTILVIVVLLIFVHVGDARAAGIFDREQLEAMREYVVHKMDERACERLEREADDGDAVAKREYAKSCSTDARLVKTIVTFLAKSAGEPHPKNPALVAESLLEARAGAATPEIVFFGGRSCPRTQVYRRLLNEHAHKFRYIEAQNTKNALIPLYLEMKGVRALPYIEVRRGDHVMGIVMDGIHRYDNADVLSNVQRLSSMAPTREDGTQGDDAQPVSTAPEVDPSCSKDPAQAQPK